MLSMFCEFRTLFPYLFFLVRFTICLCIQHIVIKILYLSIQSFVIERRECFPVALTNVAADFLVTSIEKNSS